MEVFTASRDHIVRRECINNCCPTAEVIVPDDATSVAVHPSRKFAAAACKDSNTYILALPSMEIVRTLAAHEHATYCVSFSPCGSLMVTGSVDCSIIIWDASTFEGIQALTHHTDIVNALSFSSTGLMVSASFDCSAIIYTSTLKRPGVYSLEFRLLGHTQPVTSSVFSPDGRFVLTGSYDCTIRTWDVTSGLSLLVISGHTNDINSVAISPDGARIASASDDETVRIWDLSTGNQTRSISFPDRVNAVVFVTSEQVVATGFDGSVTMHDVASGAHVASLQQHGLGIWGLAVCKCVNEG